MAMRHGISVINPHGRIFRKGVLRSTYANYQRSPRTVYDLGQCICNNCKGRYWYSWQSGDIPRYCPKCRHWLNALWVGKYWDDGTDEIPF